MFLIMSVMGIGSMWAQAPSVWNGTPANSIARGSGTKNDPYIISSAAEFVYFGSKLNNNTQYWKLGVNIDLNNMEWTYGENSANTFKGHFDGDGHTVSKYKIAPTSGKNNGLFCAMEGVSATERADVKNLTINNVSITHTDKLANTTNTGALVGNVGKHVDFADVHANNVTITFADLTNTNYVGALVGHLQKNSSITNCSVEKPSINVTGTISGGASYIGGAIGRVTGANTSEVSTINGLTITSPTVTVNKNSVNNSYIGTVFGQINNYSTFTKINVSDPSLTYKATDNPNNSLYLGTFAGGIFGNAAMETALTDVKISGNVQMTIGTGSSDISNIRAGLIGQSTTNTRMENWTIAATIVKVNGNLTVSSSYIGGLAGYIASAANAPMTLRNIKITGNSSISVSGNVAVGSHLGGIIGNASTSDATNNQTYISDVEIVGKASIAVGGNISGGSNMGGLAGYFAGRSKDNCLMEIKKVTIATSDISVGGQVSAGSCFGGLTGKVTTGCIFNECRITTAANLTFSDNIASTSYIGGAIGDFAGANGYNSYINTLTVKSSTISVKGYSEKGSLTGGVIGRISTFTEVDGVTLTGVVITSKGDVLASQQIGIFAGAITGNAIQQIPVKNITIDNSKVTLGTSGSNNIVGLKAGIIGQVNSNVLLDSWKATNCNVIKVNGNLITTGCQIGGFVGNMTSGANAPIIVNKIILEGNSGVNVSGNVTAGSQLSGIIGNASTSDAENNKTTISDVEIIGKASVFIGGNISSGSFLGGFAGAVGGRAKTDCQTEITKITIPTSDISVGGQVSAASYFGGLIGRTATACIFTDCKITTAANLTFSNNIVAGSYIGGVFGDIAGKENYPSIASRIEVIGLDISLNSDLSKNLYAGGIAGQLSAVATTPNKIEKCSVIGKIHTVGTHTFNENMLYAFGGIVGYTAQSATNVSEVSQCISNVDFNLSGLTPATKTNLYCNGFVVGGIIGRINTPSRLPEHLYYTGKIYAPYAAVAPIVGVFCANQNAATYIYNDYSGENAANISAEEWQKTNTWYFTDYKLGLSPEVISQNARTRNYSATPIVEDGINYLLVDDKTFTMNNKIGAESKKSFTVLAYNQDNNNVDYGIYPQWSKDQSDYPTYYMYYMQGLNHGVFTPKEESDFARLLMEKKLNFMPQMIHSGDAGHGYEFIVDAGRLEDDNDFTITYQWYRSDKTTPLQGETSKILGITKSELDAAGGTIYCVVTVSGGDSSVKRTLMGMASTVVFVDGKNGIDNAKGSRKRGWTPNTAVKTIDNANLLLDGGSWDNNIIVVMGMLNSGVLFQSTGSNPATLTGKWDGTDYYGIIEINKSSSEDVVNKVNQTGQKGHHCYVKADTKFEYLTFQCKSNTNDNNFIECHGNDVWFGKGLVMNNFRNLSEDHGNLEMSQNIPELSIILTATNLSEADIKTYLKRAKPQTLTIESGHYGRVMGGRFTNKFFSKNDNTSHTILGSPKYPVWAIVNIDIDKENPNKGSINRFEGSSTGMVTDGFTCDINCIVAGLTDGSMYGDYEINVHGGKVAYIVGGNQGNPVPNGSKTFTQPGGKSGNWGQWPNASYFGRTIINVEQDPTLKDITIENLYTGGLGRKANGDNATSVVDMYMYGHTEINMKSGTVLGNVYGGGAGGVMGLNPWDMHVPYATTEADNATNAIINGVQYGTWGSKKAGSTLANVTLHDSDGNGGYTEKPQNLGESYTTLNISGGTIKGNVYGGGCGYVSNMPKEVAMQGVGSVFGTSNVNILGGTIQGSVYGGSEGSNMYYGAKNKYNQEILHIAEMNGKVNLNISGMESKPTIGGTIYGGGQGVAFKEKNEYLRIATAGNYDLAGQNATEEQKKKYKTDINITIDMPENIEFHNDIYGGGALGMVDGTTNIVLKRGKFTGNIYGGGYGEKNYPDKAMVNGDITISTGDVNPANIDRGLPVMVNNTIYGGGNMAQVTGNTFVNIHHGNITCNVFGGGKGLTSSEGGTGTNYGKVTGNTHVLYNNATENNILTGNIYGGGALGDVKGNTEVKIQDGIIKGNVFGAGKGEEGNSDKAKVTGDTNVIVVDKK